MIANILLMIVGLIICFGGIRFKKLVLGITGFFTGLVAGVIVVVLLLLASIISIQNNIVPEVIIVLLVAIVFTVLYEKYFKIAAAISSFFTVLFTTIRIGAWNAIIKSLTVSTSFSFYMSGRSTNNGLDQAIILTILLGFVLATIASVISFKYYDLSFIIITAAIGSYLTILGGYGLFNNTDAFSLLQNGIPEGAKVGFIICVVVLAYIGICMQMRRFRINTQAGQAMFSAAGTVVGTTAKATGALVALTGGMISGVLELKDAEKRNAVIASIKKEKWILLALIVAMLAVPIASNMAESNVQHTIAQLDSGDWATYDRAVDGYHAFIAFLKWIDVIAFSAALAMVAYLTAYKHGVIAFAWALVCAGCITVTRGTGYWYFNRDIWFILMPILEMIGMIIISRIFRNSLNLFTIICGAAAVAVCDFFRSKLIYRSYGFDIKVIVGMIVAALVVIAAQKILLADNNQ